MTHMSITEATADVLFGLLIGIGFAALCCIFAFVTGFRDVVVHRLNLERSYFWDRAMLVELFGDDTEDPEFDQETDRALALVKDPVTYTS